MRRNCHPHTVCKQEIRSNSFIYLYLFIFKYLYCLSPDKGCLCVTLGKMVQLILNTNIFLLFSLINLWAMISMNFCSTMYSETSFEGCICEYLGNPELQKSSLEVLLTHLLKEKEYCQADSPTSDSLKSYSLNSLNY